MMRWISLLSILLAMGVACSKKEQVLPPPSPISMGADSVAPQNEPEVAPEPAPAPEEAPAADTYQ